MTSINFNASATTALRTLQQTNNSLETSQNRVSTGLKIGEAKDNAAYWAISTTLKSDNKALSTVKDALGLGAATVDTAYQGLNKTIEVLDEIKSKLTAASQDGVDKTKIQSEISELQKQLSSIATSSVFSGENWLSVNSSAAGFSSLKSVVSSFTRDASNGVAIGTIGVDISTVSLYDSSATGTGILDKKVAMGTLTVGGLGADGATGNTVGGGLKNVTTPGGQGSTSFTFVDLGYEAGAAINFTATIDGVAQNYVLSSSELATVDGGADLNADAAGMRTLLQGKLGAGVTVGGTAANITITSNTLGGASAVSITNVAVTDPANGTTVTSGGLGAAVSAAPPAAVATLDPFAAITLDDDDAITFEIALNGGAASSVRIDKATVNSALGGTTGAIANVNDYKTVLSKALSNAGVTGVTVGGAGPVTLTSGIAGGLSKVAITGFVASNSSAVMSVADIDITKMSARGATTGTQQKAALEAYITVVNTAINNVTSAASSLGAVASRIELQSSFVDTLTDTIDKGVSGLVDADLSEESTRLQALQTKQQLGIQALSIANSSTQNILALFRS